MLVNCVAYEKGRRSSAPQLSETLAPGQYFLVVTIATGLACNGGSTPCSAGQLASIEDFVGDGNANFFEGAGRGTDTEQYVGRVPRRRRVTADFSTGAPSPRNSSSAFNVCSTQGTAPEPGTLALLGLGLAGLAASGRRKR